jgi:hypothetical protein
MFRFLLMATDKAERRNKFQFGKSDAYPQCKNDAPGRNFGPMRGVEVPDISSGCRPFLT